VGVLYGGVTNRFQAMPANRIEVEGSVLWQLQSNASKHTVQKVERSQA
jgi:hypothetical protein